MREAVGPQMPLEVLDAGVTVVPGAAVWDDRLCGFVVLSDVGSTYRYEVNLVKPGGGNTAGRAAVMRIGSGGRFWQGAGWTWDGYVALCDGGSIFRVLVPSLGLVDSDGVALTQFAVLPSRYVYFDGNNVLTRPRGGGAETTELALTIGNTGPGWIFPADLSGGRSRWWLCDLPSGKVYLYDAIAKLEVGNPSDYTTTRTAVDAGALGVGYSQKHGLFWILTSDGKLRARANEPAANWMSNPVFSATPRAGQRRTVSSRLLGSNGEPCPGRVLSFSATVGSIPQPNVLTDAQGLASAAYYAPFGASVGETLTASLVE